MEGLEGLQPQARKGRSNGVRFCWKPAMGDDTAGAAKTTSVSRAWKRTAKWLGDITHTKMERVAESVRWKVRFYRHPRPNPAQASEEQVTCFKVFEDWRGSIKAGQLHSRPWLDMLRLVAEKQAEKERAAAQLDSIKGYILWVTNGPAGGLRRQHQFTRIATGWTETAVSHQNGNELGDQDELDGLSDEQTEAIRDAVGDEHSPADAQAEVNDLAVAWKKGVGPRSGG